MVEEQVARCFSILNGESCQRRALFVSFNHPLKVDIADDIDVVKDEGLVWICDRAEIGAGVTIVAAAAASAKKPCGLFQAAAGIQQNVFAGKFNVHAEIAGGFYVV